MSLRTLNMPVGTLCRIVLCRVANNLYLCRDAKNLILHGKTYVCFLGNTVFLQARPPHPRLFHFDLEASTEPKGHRQWRLPTLQRVTLILRQARVTASWQDPHHIVRRVVKH